MSASKLASIKTFSIVRPPFGALLSQTIATSTIICESARSALIHTDRTVELTGIKPNTNQMPRGGGRMPAPKAHMKVYARYKLSSAQVLHPTTARCGSPSPAPTPGQRSPCPPSPRAMLMHPRIDYLFGLTADKLVRCELHIIAFGAAADVLRTVRYWKTYNTAVLHVFVSAARS